MCELRGAGAEGRKVLVINQAIGALTWKWTGLYVPATRFRQEEQDSHHPEKRMMRKWLT